MLFLAHVTNLMSLVEIWKQAQPVIREKIGATSYETWFSNIEAQNKDNNILQLQAPDEFFKNWIVEHYRELIEATLKNLSQNIAHIEFSVNENIIQEEKRLRLVEFEKDFQPVKNHPSHLNHRFTFDHFVIGPSNRFACAASLAVAESPAKAYNPLFIYGDVGLGKTHLIQSITHKIQQLHPQQKICYLTSEQFTNELIDAIRHRSTPEFRKKYREVDVLLIDDIHFIAGKESTQEEFFNTFNSLHDNRKQIIITSDRPPKEISNLEERLRSRFEWGLTADIQPPDYETRIAILQKKVENEAVKVPQDVIQFIAEQIKTNIRELEGALIRVAAYSLLEEKKVTLELAKSILKDMVKETTKTISIEMIQKTVVDYFKMSLMELRSKHRNKNVVLARQVAMYLCRQLTHFSLPEIGNAFGGKDHTTVLHSCKKIEDQIKEDSGLKNLVMELTTILQQ